MKLHAAKNRYFGRNLRKVYEKRILSEFVKRKHHIAKEALALLIDQSPFSTGSYIASHRVGINVMSTDYTIMAPGTTTREAIKAEALIVGQAAIMASKIMDSIYLSNGIFYAANVEYLGWVFTPPYFTYATTREYIRHAAQQIMRYKGDLPGRTAIN